MLKSLQFFINSLYRQPHDIEIRAFKPRHSDIADPFLYAIRTRLVEGTVFRDILLYLLIGEMGESDIGLHAEMACLCLCPETYACDDMVRLAAESA